MPKSVRANGVNAASAISQILHSTHLVYLAAARNPFQVFNFIFPGFRFRKGKRKPSLCFGSAFVRVSARKIAESAGVIRPGTEANASSPYGRHFSSGGRGPCRNAAIWDRRRGVFGAGNLLSKLLPSGYPGY